MPEMLPKEDLQKMGPKLDVPVLEAKDLPTTNGFLFCFPTVYGLMMDQFKAFLDGIGRSQALIGKPVGIFISGIGSQGGPLDTSTLEAITLLAHHRVIIVPTGMYEMTGGSSGDMTFRADSEIAKGFEVPAGGRKLGNDYFIEGFKRYTEAERREIFRQNRLTFPGDGSEEPTEEELNQAFHQGKYTAEITKKLQNIGNLTWRGPFSSPLNQEHYLTNTSPYGQQSDDRTSA